jgi:hypothetical protein
MISRIKVCRGPLAVAALLAATMAGRPAASADVEADVVVYGATATGLAAALQSAHSAEALSLFMTSFPEVQSSACFPHMCVSCSMTRS